MAAVDEASSQYEYWREARTAQELAAVTHQPGHATPLVARHTSTNPATLATLGGPARHPPAAAPAGTGVLGSLDTAAILRGGEAESKCISFILI